MQKMICWMPIPPQLQRWVKTIHRIEKLGKITTDIILKHLSKSNINVFLGKYFY